MSSLTVKRSETRGKRTHPWDQPPGLHPKRSVSKTQTIEPNIPRLGILTDYPDRSNARIGYVPERTLRSRQESTNRGHWQGRGKAAGRSGLVERRGFAGYPVG